MGVRWELLPLLVLSVSFRAAGQTVDCTDFNSCSNTSYVCTQRFTTYNCNGDDSCSDLDFSCDGRNNDAALLTFNCVGARSCTGLSIESLRPIEMICSGSVSCMNTTVSSLTVDGESYDSEFLINCTADNSCENLDILHTNSDDESLGLVIDCFSPGSCNGIYVDCDADESSSPSLACDLRCNSLTSCQNGLMDCINATQQNCFCNEGLSEGCGNTDVVRNSSYYLDNDDPSASIGTTQTPTTSESSDSSSSTAIEDGDSSSNEGYTTTDLFRGTESLSSTEIIDDGGRVEPEEDSRFRKHSFTLISSDGYITFTFFFLLVLSMTIVLWTRLIEEEFTRSMRVVVWLVLVFTVECFYFFVFCLSVSIDLSLRSDRKHHSPKNFLLYGSLIPLCLHCALFSCVLVYHNKARHTHHKELRLLVTWVVMCLNFCIPDCEDGDSQVQNDTNNNINNDQLKEADQLELQTNQEGQLITEDEKHAKENPEKVLKREMMEIGTLTVAKGTVRSATPSMDMEGEEEDTPEVSDYPGSVNGDKRKSPSFGLFTQWYLMCWLMVTLILIIVFESISSDNHTDGLVGMIGFLSSFGLLSTLISLVSTSMDQWNAEGENSEIDEVYLFNIYFTQICNVLFSLLYFFHLYIALTYDAVRGSRKESFIEDLKLTELSFEVLLLYLFLFALIYIYRTHLFYHLRSHSSSKSMTVIEYSMVSPNNQINHNNNNNKPEKMGSLSSIYHSSLGATPPGHPSNPHPVKIQPHRINHQKRESESIAPPLLHDLPQPPDQQPPNRKSTAVYRMLSSEPRSPSQIDGPIDDDDQTTLDTNVYQRNRLSVGVDRSPVNGRRRKSGPPAKKTSSKLAKNPPLKDKEKTMVVSRGRDDAGESFLLIEEPELDDEEDEKLNVLTDSTPGGPDDPAFLAMDIDDDGVSSVVTDTSTVVRGAAAAAVAAVAPMRPPPKSGAPPPPMVTRVGSSSKRHSHKLLSQFRSQKIVMLQNSDFYYKIGQIVEVFLDHHTMPTSKMMKGMKKDIKLMKWQRGIVKNVSDKGRLLEIELNSTAASSTGFTTEKKSGVPIIVDLHETPECIRHVLSEADFKALTSGSRSSGLYHRSLIPQSTLSRRDSVSSTGTTMSKATTVLSHPTSYALSPTGSAMKAPSVGPPPLIEGAEQDDDVSGGGGAGPTSGSATINPDSMEDDFIVYIKRKFRLKPPPRIEERMSKMSRERRLLERKLPLPPVFGTSLDLLQCEKIALYSKPVPSVLVFLCGMLDEFDAFNVSDLFIARRLNVDPQNQSTRELLMKTTENIYGDKKGSSLYYGKDMEELQLIIEHREEDTYNFLEDSEKPRFYYARLFAACIKNFLERLPQCLFHKVWHHHYGAAHTQSDDPFNEALSASDESLLTVTRSRGDGTSDESKGDDLYYFQSDGSRIQEMLKVMQDSKERSTLLFIMDLCLKVRENADENGMSDEVLSDVFVPLLLQIDVYSEWKYHLDPEVKQTLMDWFVVFLDSREESLRWAS